MEWVPITVTGRRVRGRNRQYSGLLDVEIDLSGTPPKPWAESSRVRAGSESRSPCTRPPSRDRRSRSRLQTMRWRRTRSTSRSA
jgi:hypothetical protein